MHGQVDFIVLEDMSLESAGACRQFDRLAVSFPSLRNFPCLLYIYLDRSRARRMFQQKKSALFAGRCILSYLNIELDLHAAN